MTVLQMMMMMTMRVEGGDDLADCASSALLLFSSLEPISYNTPMNFPGACCLVGKKVGGPGD